jgi:hypothetical protein
MDLVDRFDQAPLVELGHRGDAVAVACPVVVRRGRHPGNLTGGLYREPVSRLLVDEAVEGHSFDSFTQKAVSTQRQPCVALEDLVLVLLTNERPNVGQRGHVSLHRADVLVLLGVLGPAGHDS